MYKYTRFSMYTFCNLSIFITFSHIYLQFLHISITDLNTINSHNKPHKIKTSQHDRNHHDINRNKQSVFKHPS